MWRGCISCWLSRNLQLTFLEIWRLDVGWSFLPIHSSWICPNRLQFKGCYLSGKIVTEVFFEFFPWIFFKLNLSMGLFCSEIFFVFRNRSLLTCFRHCLIWISINSVFTPYYAEDVLYSKDKLTEENEDGISILFYLQKIFPGELMIARYILYRETVILIHWSFFWHYLQVCSHYVQLWPDSLQLMLWQTHLFTYLCPMSCADEWKNFLERQGLTNALMERQMEDKKNDCQELRLWASYRGQTLARTGRVDNLFVEKCLSLVRFPCSSVFIFYVWQDCDFLYWPLWWPVFSPRNDVLQESANLAEPSGRNLRWVEVIAIMNFGWIELCS